MWSAVYKRTYGKDYKLKAGYDSDVRLGWASLWVNHQPLVFFSLFSHQRNLFTRLSPNPSHTSKML